MFRVLFLFFVFLAVACQKDQDELELKVERYNWDLHIPFETNYGVFSMPYIQDFQALPQAIGTVAMSEASGLAWSRVNPGMIWSHNDSGHPNHLFLIDASTGEIMARYRINGSVNIDWEDIEIAEGPEYGVFYIYLADTGDNDERRPSYTIYRFPEPVYLSEHYGTIVDVSDQKVDALRFMYPDGSHDTESLFVDPFTKDIFLVTKRDVFSTLYVAPYPQSDTEMFVLYKAGTFSFREASAATASFDGSKVLIKNRQDIFYWEREPGESAVEMLARTPVRAPYSGEPQGEAICFDPDNNYYTLSEALNSSTPPVLFKYFFNF